MVQLVSVYFLLIVTKARIKLKSLLLFVDLEGELGH